MTRKNKSKTAARARQATFGGHYQAHLRAVGGGGDSGLPGLSPWICSACKLPIAKGDGHVFIMDAETRGYPQRATPTDSELSELAREKHRAEGQRTEPPFQSVTLSEILSRRPEIDFGAYHRECDPKPDANPYAFSVDDAPTLEAWCGWIHHVGEKLWMSKVDVSAMLDFWFENRGRSVPR